ncbi:MAG TPA: hypothetical protein V6C72_08795 [Chroococcales cyanobacterium]
MSYSDDYASPAADFSGGEGGDIFESPDMVQGSPTTSERVLDTQSGFLVVVKAVDKKLALSVKRRLGTPPASSILLTAEESQKLARILSGRKIEGDASADAKRLQESANRDLSRRLGKIRGSGELSESFTDEELSRALQDAAAQTSRTARRRQRREAQKQLGGPFNFDAPIKIIIGVSVVALVAAGVIFASTHSHPAIKADLPPTAAVTASASNGNSADDGYTRFASQFVGDLLDFNARTYRVSQVHAMAAMSPELMEKYWQETNFPQSLRKLHTQANGRSIVITKVDQQPLNGSDSKRAIEVYAELVSNDSKMSSPVHIGLTVERQSDGFLVLDQKDLSTKK